MVLMLPFSSWHQVCFLCWHIFIYLVLFFNKFIYFLFIYFWLRWVFIAVCGLSLVVASGGYSLLRCTGFSTVVASRCGARALGARASVVVVRGLSCSAACGIFLDQGSNQCPLHWQADS